MKPLLNTLYLILGLPILAFFFLYFWVWGVVQPRESGEFWDTVDDPYR